MKIYFFVLIIFISSQLYSQTLSTKNQQKVDKILQKIESAKKSNDTQKIGELNKNLGDIYASADIKKAETYYIESLQFTEDPYDKIGLCINLAQLLGNANEYPKVVKYYLTAEKYANQTQNQKEIYDINLAVGDTYILWNKPKDAINAFHKSLQISLDLQNRWKVTKCLNRLIETYTLLKDKNQAEITKKLLSENFDIIEIAVFGQKKTEQFKAELFDLKKIVSLIGNENQGLKDSIMSQIVDIEQLQKAISSLSDTLNAQQAALKNINLELEHKRSELTKVETYLERRNIALSISVFIILIIGFLAVLAYRNYIVKKKQHHLLEIQRQEILTKNEEITKQNEEITGSIRYAERIQKALFPPVERFSQLFPESFIFFKPRDIVSGDFYWISEKNNKIIVAAVDCTGHSVPGAFMSVLGITFLDEIVNKNNILTANEIINQLRDSIIKSFHQSEFSSQTKDGMDLALVVIDKKSMKMEYAGAYNPLILVRNSEATIYKADRKPAGFHDKFKDSFTNHVIDIRKDDRIYLSSDGYLDQFGGETAKKFLLNRFTELITKTSELPMNEQFLEIEQTFTKWKGTIDQVDDVVVLGIKI